MTTNNRQQTTTAVSLNEKAVIRKLSLCSILGNTVLSGFKLFAGVTGHSGAMISDAIHSLFGCAHHLHRLVRGENFQEGPRPGPSLWP